MPTSEEVVKDLNEKRLRAWEAGKEILDRAVAEGRAMTQEELDSHKRADDEITRLDKTRDAFLSDSKRVEERARLEEEFRRNATPDEFRQAEQRDNAMLDAFFKRGGNVTEMEVDLRPAARAYEAIRQGATGQEFRLIAGDTGASGGSLTIPTTVASTIYQYMTANVAMRRMRTTILTSPSGNPWTFPKVSTHGIATQVATQDTAFAGTDPVLAAMTLNAFDYGQLVAISNDVLDDSGSDILGFVAQQIGRAIGQVTATAYVTGSGSGAPNGIMTALGGAGTVATGGSLILGAAGQVVEKLIDLQYSVVDAYRSQGCEWLMRDLTGAVVRKLRDGAGGTTGAFLWQPSQTVGLSGGQPDRFLNDPVFFDPNVASMASDAKVIAYGDFSAYYIRDVAGFKLDRSDDLLFNKNQVAFRGLLRTDGDLIDTAAINVLHQAVS